MNYEKSFFIHVSLLLLLILSPAISAQPLNEMLKQGDNYLDVSFNNDEAMKIYLKAIFSLPHHY